ncbi:MAG: hypothetical protein NT116_00700, partial [Candidatus Parcubacteria bacterium]|nr:hypothetical protein [Candidatus Parcubacteria bacterium]
MPEIQKHLSKGMRRHIRKKKAEEAKKQGLKESGQIRQIAREKNLTIQRERTRLENLPDFQSFPVAGKEDRMFFNKYFCPHCYAGENDRVKITIETKQGEAIISECR